MTLLYIFSVLTVLFFFGLILLNINTFSFDQNTLFILANEPITRENTERLKPFKGSEDYIENIIYDTYDNNFVVSDRNKILDDIYSKLAPYNDFNDLPGDN